MYFLKLIQRRAFLIFFLAIFTPSLAIWPLFSTQCSVKATFLILFLLKKHLLKSCGALSRIILVLKLLLFIRLSRNRKTLSSFRSSCINYRPSRGSAHSGSKTMGSCSFNFTWLVCSFHYLFLCILLATLLPQGMFVNSYFITYFYITYPQFLHRFVNIFFLWISIIYLNKIIINSFRGHRNATRILGTMSC